MLDSLPIMAVVALGLLLVLAWRTGRAAPARHQQRIWNRLAAQFGLPTKHMQGDLFMEGQAADFSLKASLKKTDGLELEISSPDIPREIRWYPRRGEKGHGISHDKTFDRVVRMDGPAALLLSMLDTEARDVIRHGVQLCMYLQHGKLHAVIKEEKHLEAPALVDIFDTAVKAVQVSVPKASEVPERLAHMAIYDRNPPTRAQALRHWLDGDDGQQGEEDLVERSLGDRAPEVRAVAAMRRGVEEIDLIRQLVLDAATPVSVRDELITHLSRNTSKGASSMEVKAILDELMERCLEHDDASFRRPAIRHLKPTGFPLTTERWEGLFENASAEGILELLDVAANRRVVQLEKTLLSLLEHVDFEVQVSAAHTLEHCGSEKSILPLRAVAEELATPARLKEAAQQSLDALSPSSLPDGSKAASGE